ncbi:MAG TPA: hypothetical protein VMN60_10920 [Longimicrobiales bacterium]|nr:hypothetical protein [Longimicrobiales bacterium]
MKLLSIGAAAVPTTLVMAALIAPMVTPSHDVVLGCEPGVPAAPGTTPPSVPSNVVINGQFGGTARSSMVEAFQALGIAPVTGEGVHHIIMTCWDPVKQELGPTGVKVAYLVTKSFMATLHADLERVVAAQDAFRKQNARYAGSLDEIDVALATTSVTFTLAGADDGWEATAGSTLLIETCHVFAGTIRPSRAELEERAPACFPLAQYADWNLGGFR